MIVKMNKIHLVTLTDDVKGTLEKLQDFGAVHMEQVKTAHADVDKAQKELVEIDRTRSYLDSLELASTEGQIDLDSHQIVLETMDIKEALAEKRSRLKVVDQLTQVPGPWGSLAKDELDPLLEAGLDFRLYVIPDKELKKLPVKEMGLVPLESGFAAQVGYELEPLLDFQEIPAPEFSIDRLKQEKTELVSKITGLEERLSLFRGKAEQLTEASLKAMEKLEFEKVKVSSEDYDQLVSFTGYIPVGKTPSLQALCQKEGFGLLIEEPQPGDPVPTLVENNKGVGIIKPVFGFLGTIPGYWEKDTSFFFLVFFALFFGIILGDAGYGSLILLGTLGFHASMIAKKKEAPPALWLTYVLSISTVLWGAITGNWFGYTGFVAEGTFLGNFAILADFQFNLSFLNLLGLDKITLGELALEYSRSPEFALDPDFLTTLGFSAEEASSLVTQSVNLTPDANAAFLAFDTVSKSVVQSICFWIAVVHLSIAQLWNFLWAVKGQHKLKALSELGWLSMNIALFNVVMSLVVGTPVWEFGIWMIVGGFGFVFIFSNQEGNFFKGLGASAGDIITLVLSGINAFSDLVSYIRLFAVGLASFKIAESFNSIALGFGFETVDGVILTILVLLIGHGLNLIMGLMSVLVHGVRLNLLEFSGRLGMEWSGMAYHPFKRWLLNTTTTKE